MQIRAHVEERNVILKIIEKVKDKDNSEQLLSEILRRTLTVDLAVTIEEVDLEKEIESSGEEEDLKLKKRKSTKQDPFKFGRSKRDKSLHPVYLIFDRLKLTPISKIKDPLPKTRIDRLMQM